MIRNSLHSMFISIPLVSVVKKYVFNFSTSMCVRKQKQKIACLTFVFVQKNIDRFEDTKPLEYKLCSSTTFKNLEKRRKQIIQTVIILKMCYISTTETKQCLRHECFSCTVHMLIQIGHVIILQCYHFRGALRQRRVVRQAVQMIYTCRRVEGSR